MDTLGAVRVYRTLRNFLFSTVNKEFFVFLFFLVVSAGFWLMLTFNETSEKDILVPVRVVGVPNNVVITDPLPDTIRVTVRDKGFGLFRYFYVDGVSPVEINFSVYARSNGKATIPMADFQKLLKANLAGSTKILSVKADKLEFTFTYGESKYVKVAIAGNVRPADTYCLVDQRFSCDSVKVYADRNLLRNIRVVYTENLNIVGFTDTITRDVKLRKISGVKIVPDHITVKFYPDVLTEKVVSVPVTSVNMPDGLALRTFPAQVNVKAVIARSRLSSIVPDNFRVVVDYNDVVAHPSDKCSVILKGTPSGVSSATLETEQVDYLIENVR